MFLQFFIKFMSCIFFPILKRRSSRRLPSIIQNPRSCSPGLAGEGWRPWPCSLGRRRRSPGPGAGPPPRCGRRLSSPLPPPPRGPAAGLRVGWARRRWGVGARPGLAPFRAASLPPRLVLPHALLDLTYICLGGAEMARCFFSCSFCRSRIMACCGSGLAWFW